MEPSIYSFSLCTALPLMLFFGFYFLFAKTPEKKIFKNYLRSRQIMGIAMLLLSANYSVHFFFGIRFKNADSSILTNRYGKLEECTRLPLKKLFRGCKKLKM
jgi:hypothetical protein